MPRQTVPPVVLALVAAIACWLVSSALLPSGVMAQSMSGSTIVEHTGPRPNNALITNGGWRCPDGYALGASNRCMPVRAPSNAIVTGNVWRCMAGFVQRSGTCERLVAPAYGFIQGKSIECTAGYRLSTDDKCVVVVPPQNAIVAGNDWRCLPGY
ncbi:MAG: hypothetical protein VW495_07520, partial [Rhodobiaceae bacterium]